MAARLRKTHQDDVRTKIKVSNLIDRLEKFAMGELSDDDISSNRLNAIKLLLSKTLPDLSSVTVEGPGGDGEHTIVQKIELVALKK
jgi:hypothetical protein